MMNSTLDKTSNREIPMPGEKVDGYTVIASCWVIDEQGHDAERVGEDGCFLADVLLLGIRSPYYHVSRVSATLDSDGWHMLNLGAFYENVIPAAEAYSDVIGGY